MKTKQALVPQLRFKEHNGKPYPDWHEKKLGDVGIIKSGVGFPEKEQGGKQGIPFYKVSDMNLYGNSHTMTTANNYVTDDQIADKKYKTIREKSIIFAKVGAAVFLERKRIAENFLLDNNMMAFTPTFDINFGKYLFSQIRLSKYAQVGALPSYNGSDIATIKASVPSLPEQEKIAAFLTSVDDRIDQLKRKKSLLQDYKKGAMQKLFSQELRFKDEQGNDFPDWEEKKLGEVLKIGSGKDYKHLNKGDIPVYGSGGLMTHVDQFLYEGESVCIGRKGTIDKPQFMSGKFWTVDTLFYTHNFKGVIPRFILSVFQQITWYRHNEAGGVPSLSKKTIENIFIDIPSLPEQTKIANFLSSLDQKIEQVDTQITQTQTFKKGLLQQMFV